MAARQKRSNARLAKYNAKRDFSRTSEPRGETGRSRRNALGFFVQKHAARRLHYDLRLEWNGVLLSWAVTRGPSSDPLQKRLAVRTEDHPLSYAEFEGTIPAKEYGGGTVMLWDKGHWVPREDADQGLESGKLKFSVRGERMQGGWTLVRMKGKERSDRENWLLIKERDEDAGNDPDELVDAYTTSVATARTMEEIARDEAPRGSKGGSAPRATRAKARKRKAAAGSLPTFQSPALATLTDTVPEGADWLHESKLDGYRCIAAVAGAAARCYSRSGHDWSDRFRPVAEALAGLGCDSALLDGEVVAPGAAAGSRFSALQNALSRGGALAYYAFDLLELDGDDLRSRPLVERKAELRKLIGTVKGKVVNYSEHVRGNGGKVFAAMCQGGGEGIVSKKANSTYRGQRTMSWLKTKCTKRQEFVIGGFTPSDKRGRPFASLLLGTFEEGKFLYRGRVGSGFSSSVLDEIAKRLQPLSQKKPPFDSVPGAVGRRARWVRPELVAEIDFNEFTNEGYVRHGVFKGLREDKKAGRVTLERAPDAAHKAREEFKGIRISHPHRVVYPEQGITKIDLAAYYDAVGERMLPLVADRPLSLLRCPKGRTGRNAECFFQKHGGAGFPRELERVSIREKSGERAEYLYVDRIEGVVSAVQMGTLEFHIWGSKVDALEKPDRLVFDLDPDEKVGFDAVALAAVLIRKRLQDLGLESVPLVTGGKGVHIVVPLRRTADWPQVKSFAQAFASKLADDEPDVFTATMSKSRRHGRIFVDWLRNERGATAIAPYSTRARTNGPVATPVSWNELRDLESAHAFHIDDVVRRVKGTDPWRAAMKWRQAVTKGIRASFGA